MKRVVRVVAVFALATATGLAVLPTGAARPAPAADLQMIAVGGTGVTGVKFVCRRNFEGCVASTIHGCKGPC